MVVELTPQSVKQGLPTLPAFRVEELLKPQVKAETVTWQGTPRNPHDVVKEVEEVLIDPPRIAQFNEQLHMYFLSQLKVPLEESWASEAGLADNYRTWRAYLEHLPESLPGEREMRLQRLDDDVWPRLKPILANNPALAAWSRIFGACSEHANMFILNVHEKRLAEAMVAAHFCDWSILGKLDTIVPVNGSFVSCAAEECFVWARERAQCIQQELVRVNDVLYLGGGCDASLWARDFQMNATQRAVIYDAADCRKSMTDLLGKSLDDARIDYRIGDMRAALSNPLLFGGFDCVVASGLFSYFREELPEVLGSVKKLLRPGGKCVFDLQTKHLTYLYVSKVHEWPGGRMTLEESPEAARQAVDEICYGLGMSLVSTMYDPVNKAGVCFTVVRPNT